MDKDQPSSPQREKGNAFGLPNVADIEKMANAIFKESFKDFTETSVSNVTENEAAQNQQHSETIPNHSVPEEPNHPSHSGLQFNPKAGNKSNGKELFDPSGDQCLIAPILPKLVGPEVAEKIIATAGSPKQRISDMGMRFMPTDLAFIHPGSFHLPSSWTGDEGFSSRQSEAPLETLHQSDIPSTQSNFYFLEDMRDEFYFQPKLTSSPEEAKDKTSDKKNKHENKNEDRDWSNYRMFHPETVRKDFPVLQQKVNGKPLVWLDNGATTQKPQAVIDSVSRFYERDNSNIHRGAHTLAARATDAYEDARDKIRKFIGAPSKDEILFVRGTTEGLNLLANTIGWQCVGQGDEIILTMLEHHANIVPWQMLAQERGAKLRVVPINSQGDIMIGEYEKLFNHRTRLVSLTHVSNAIGTVVPVAEMIATAHRRGVPVIIDGAQSVQHMPINVQALDADFFVFSGHKIFAPTGIGVVYGKREFLESMPPWQGGGNMIDRVTFEETTYNGIPARFEAGTPSIADAIGLGAAIDYVQKIGMENIHHYESQLMEYMVASLRTVPRLRIVGEPRERAGALSFTMDGIPTQTVGQLLDREGIAVRSGHHCAQPVLRYFGLESSVRPSLAFYNTYEDIDRLREALLRLS